MTTIKTDKIDKTDKDDTDDNITEMINNNIIRKITKYINCNYFDNKNIYFKEVYRYIHHFFTFLIGIIAVFNNNIIHLSIVLLIITLDAFSVVVFHECPLTTLEEKYVETTTCAERRNTMQKLNIVYNCNHEYEKTLEILINAWILIAIKCLLIMFFKTFNIKIVNYNNIYMV